MTDREQSLAMLKLKHDGESCEEIGRRFGMTRSSVRRRIKAIEREIAMPRAADGNIPRMRSRSVSIARMAKREIERGRMEFPVSEMAAYYVDRPKVRADCFVGENAKRPCIWLTCKFNLYLDVSEDTGAIKLNFPDIAVEDLPFNNCALDHADEGGLTLEAVGALTSTTRERARQVIERALTSVHATSPRRVYLRIVDTLDALNEMDPDRATVEAPTSTALDTLPRVVRVLPPPPPAQERPTLDAEGRAIAALGMVRTNPRRIVHRGRP